VQPAPKPDKRDKKAKRASLAHDDDDEDGDDLPVPPHRRTRAAFVAAVLLIASVAIGTFVLLGHLNASRYLIACAPDEIRAERGRAFPPWGARELMGAEWKAIAIPADAECKPDETDDADQLAGWFLDRLVERAEKSLLARDPAQAEVASVQLQQALLLARAPERRDQRHAVERLLGDVDYWRATGKLTAARALLLDAAKQFDSAAAQIPRHVTDAAGQAAFARRLADDLQAGPGGVRAGSASTAAAAAATPEHPAAPPGVALPVEPLPSASPPPPTPDAGVPAGGVLL
jgi:hypothetical protein